MNFVENSNRIFAQAVKDYHRTDDVDSPMPNPYAEGTIEYDLYLKLYERVRGTHYLPFTIIQRYNMGI